jgi:ABC-type polysaccharide/polyol phosphate export permease
VYGLAELLVHTIQQPQVFGTLIPAIGATPYLLSSAIYPFAALPGAIRPCAWLLPWTHAVSVLRWGLLGDKASGLAELWPGHSIGLMAVLSLGVLALAATTTQLLSHRRFAAATTR